MIHYRGLKFNRQRLQWFKDKEPLISDAKNDLEAQTRLVWLSEGSLHYHIYQTPVPQHDGQLGSLQEKELFKQFLIHLSRISQSAPLPGGNNNQN